MKRSKIDRSTPTSISGHKAIYRLAIKFCQ